MMARSGKIGPQPLNGKRRRQKKRKNNKIRFDIALNVPGAELRLPALPRVRFGWRFLSGILVVGLLGLLYTLWNSPIYQVNTANVSGIKRLSTNEINMVLDVGGASVFAVEPKKIVWDLSEAFPELYNISVRVQFPAQVSVSVEERQPVLTWQQDGLTLWVDESGVAFPPRGDAPVSVMIEAPGFSRGSITGRRHYPGISAARSNSSHSDGWGKRATRYALAV